MISIRCSSLPEAFSCPESIRGDGVRVTRSHPAAASGSAAHHVLAEHVSGREADVAAAARSYGAEPEEVGYLVRRGQAAWAKLSPEMPGATAEVYTSWRFFPGTEWEFELTGHLDVLALMLDERRAAFVDWKGGRLDRSYYHQLMGYAALILANFPHVDEVVGAVVWLRDGEIEPYRFTRAQVETWIRRLRDEVVGAAIGSFRTGDHCQHCARAHDCPGARAMVRRDVEAIGGEEVALLLKDGIGGVPAARLGELVRKAKTVARVCAAVTAAAKKHVEDVGGALDIGDGLELAIETTERRRIKPAEAWPILQDALGPRLADVVKVGIGDLMEVVGELAPPRMKGKNRAALSEALETAGAFARDQTDSLTERRKQ